MSKHRAQVRPRYGRIAALGSSLTVTVIACLGGAGVLSSSADVGRAPERASAESSSQSGTRDVDPSVQDAASSARESTRTTERQRRTERDQPDPAVVNEAVVDEALPADSGEGRRVVFSEGRQRVWLVDEEGDVVRTYLVSGSLYDNLEPGTFEVYSRSEDAVGIDDSGTMKYFVRFTQGDAGGAIGFHDIPIADGEPVQKISQLGIPLSHGCIRQQRPDAIALWEFAPLGTTVVVTV
ncbi:MAG: L,D-transpeptidase [Actinomycetota bacterium]|nr:L,D-transpeptidase [Actinomycetota bacterium]